MSPATPDGSDGELVERARGGDRGAIAALIARHQGRVYRFGLKMCGDPEDAKDVLQDTLLAMARNAGGFRGKSALSTCRMFAPIFEDAAARHPDVAFGKVDTEAQPGLAAAFQIRSNDVRRELEPEGGRV